MSSAIITRIDPVTGEIIDAGEAQTAFPVQTMEILDKDDIVSFQSIDAAEQALSDLMEEGESLKIRQAEILIAIRDGDLYKQKMNPLTEKPYRSMEEYLKHLCKSAIGFSADAPRTLKSSMTKVQVYKEQLGRTGADILDMNSHYEVLLPAAARNKTTMELTEQDVPLVTGGTQLGRQSFEGLVVEIEGKVQDARLNPDVPEKAWSVARTRERVREILGKEDTAVNFEGTASLVGDLVHWTDLTIHVGDRQYKIGDKMPLEMFKRFAGGWKINGLPERWKN
jgi:hypothetical protein